MALTTTKESILANAIKVRGIVEGGGMEKSYGAFGLCYLLTAGGRWYDGVPVPFNMGTSVLDDIFEQWPEFTGDLGYPVPCPDNRSASVAYNHASDYSRLYEGEYGAARIRLLQFIIDTLTQELI